MDAMYYLGIDGGGSVTSCCCIDENANELLHIKGGSVNYRFEGMEKARENMRRMLEEIKSTLGGEPAAAFIGNSALGGEAPENELKEFTEGIFRCPVKMHSDVYIALKACCADNACIVIAGTGSMAAGFDRDGNVVTRGGFGAVLGDEGSGYRIAEQALRTAVLSMQDAVPFTALEDEAFDFFDVFDNDSLIDRFCGGLTRGEIAAFAERVCECAANGDAAADAVISEQTRLLSLTVKSLIGELPSKPNIFVSGGMFKNDVFRCYFKKHMNADSLFTPQYSPEFAAALEAKISV